MFITSRQGLRSSKIIWAIFRSCIFAQIRKLAPLLVPVTINAIVGAEDIIDAMDLRAFGVRPRTWVHQLTYTRDDKVLIAIGVTALGLG